MSDAENVASFLYEQGRGPEDPPWGLLSVTRWEDKDGRVLVARDMLDRGEIPPPVRDWRP